MRHISYFNGLNPPKVGLTGQPALVTNHNMESDTKSKCNFEGKNCVEILKITFRLTARIWYFR
jgi:hypothetical protein